MSLAVSYKADTFVAIATDKMVIDKKKKNKGITEDTSTKLRQGIDYIYALSGPEAYVTDFENSAKPVNMANFFNIITYAKKAFGKLDSDRQKNPPLKDAIKLYLIVASNIDGGKLLHFCISPQNNEYSLTDLSGAQTPVFLSPNISANELALYEKKYNMPNTAEDASLLTKKILAELSKVYTTVSPEFNIEQLKIKQPAANA